MKTKSKSMPTLKNDDSAEDFVASSDLSIYDVARFKPMKFEIEAKSAALNLRLPQSLLSALKIRAKAKGIPYTRYVRMLLETDLAKPSA